MTARAGAALVLVAVGVVAADAAVLCATRKGAVFLRETCRRKEKAIALPAGPEGPAGPQGDPGPAAGPTMRLIDATGKEVGILPDPRSVEGGSAVLVRHGTRFIGVPFDRLDAEGSFAHVGPDCAGPRLLFSEPGFVRRGHAIAGTIYYAEDPVTETPTLTVERMRSGTDCLAAGGTSLPNGFCCEVDARLGAFGPAIAAFAVGELGTPPFQIEFGQ